MNDITTVDSNDCRTVGGVGVGLRQGVPDTIKTDNIKGTYFIAGIGDDYTSKTVRDSYFSMSGSITFDGGGSATMISNKDSEGEITSTKNTYAYQVVPTLVPGKDANSTVTMDVLNLFTSDSATTPYASALIGNDGQILAFYQSGNTRFLGIAVLQKP